MGLVRERVIYISFRLPLKVRLAASSWAGLGWAGLGWWPLYSLLVKRFIKV